jgi:RNA polymerase sigma-70 factor (ECF subfamily)
MSQREADLPDAVLIEMARTGEASGFDVLVRRWDPAFRAAALRLLSYNSHDAEEAVQETWFQIHRALGSLENLSSGRSWGYCILSNVCLKYRTRQRRQRELGFSSSPGADPPENTAASEGTLQRLAEAIQAMPEAYREATILRYLQKLSYAEVAVALGVAVGTAKSNVARGIAWLENNLKPGGTIDESL